MNIAKYIVERLLDQEPVGKGTVWEASVHLPHRGKLWVAAFTGPHGGQVWRSTGLDDRGQALLLAKRLEAEARAYRLSLGRPLRNPTLRARRQQPGNARSGPLTQKEVAMLLGMSERGARAVERRALQKLSNHPLLRQVWQQYQRGELEEHQSILTPGELGAFFSAARTPEEGCLISKSPAANPMLTTRSSRGGL